MRRGIYLSYFCLSTGYDNLFIYICIYIIHMYIVLMVN